jgi:quercetin dioxygenase-like cupin family protein
MGPNRLEIKATSENTDGRFFLSESTIAPDFPGPPPHVHDQLCDMFYVLEGTLTVLFEGTEHELGPGSFVCVAPGDVHTFRNDAAAGASGTPPTREEIGAIASKYDFRPA